MTVLTTCWPLLEPVGAVERPGTTGFIGSVTGSNGASGARGMGEELESGCKLDADWLPVIEE